MLKDKQILIVSPHPDDEAIDSGGLIMLAKRQGAKVFVLYMATGASRQFTTGKGETFEDQRIEEAGNASDFGGFDYNIAFGNISTKVDTLPQKDLIEAIEDAVKEIKPDIVVIPYRDSYSQDHRAVATACVSAFRPIPEAIHPQPKLILEVEEPTVWPSAPQPNFYFDISEVFKDKIELYKCHVSQLVKEPHYRSFENLERLAGMRGAEIGVRYAEAYRLLKGQLL